MKKMYKTFYQLLCVASTLLLLVSLSCAAQIKSQAHTSTHLNLHDALSLALRYNPNVQIAHMDRTIEKFNLRVAQNAFEMQYAITGNLDYLRTRFNNVEQSVNYSQLTPTAQLTTQYGTRFEASAANTYHDGHYYSQAVLSVTQPLLKGWGKEVVKAPLQNAEDADRMNQLQVKQQVMDIVAQVIRNYRRIILDHNNTQIQKNSLRDVKKTIWVNKKKIKAGILEPTVNVQQNVQLQAIQLQLLQAENIKKQDAQNLLLLIGLDPALTMTLDMKLTMPEKPFPDLQRAIDIALMHNPQYQQIQIQLQEGQRAVTVAKNQLLPTLDVTAKASVGQSPNLNPKDAAADILDHHNYNEEVRLDLRIPIDDLPTHVQLIEAKENLEKEHIQLAASKRALITQVKNQHTEIQSQYRQYQLSKKRVTLAARAYKLEQKKQAVGRASSLDVTTSQNNWINAKMQLMTNQMNYLNAVTQLQETMGVLLDEWQIRVHS